MILFEQSKSAVALSLSLISKLSISTCTIHQRMLYSEFDGNRLSSSEEVGNVKRLQTDGQTDSRRTKCDQESSFEFSVQVS